MPRFISKSLKKVGSSPGTLIHVGEIKTEQSSLSMLHFDAETHIEQPLTDIGEATSLLTPDATTWINVVGIQDIALIEDIGRHYHIHPLTLEDILNTTQRPKVESFDDYLFIVIKMLEHDKEKDSIVSEQLSLVLGKTVLISFQEDEGDVFNPVRERIRKGKGRIRSAGCDYLAYALIDAIVDNYFVILENVGQRLEAVEEAIDSDLDADILEKIHTIRRELIYLRKQVWPIREIITYLQKDGAPLIGEATGPFLRDVYDHTIQVIDTIESLRDMLSGMQDLYLSIISNRMNEVMKVLTIIATIFIPLSFIAGIYGMNFNHMPELTWRWGYPAVWLLIIGIVAMMIVFFRRKKWI
ncbi:CorA: magnesium transport protein [Desulfosarcina variabilis str. Montpellier]|uniref:magnesium/cobalt transporter CorA n=1 Tax=Desulfosarcina variabilis TaxID=2300 RepID=UPI003AFB6579